MDQNPSQSQIPRAAIRTMQKDLAGVVFEEWEEVLAESEILEVLNNFKKGPVKEEGPDLQFEQELKIARQKEIEETEEKKKIESESLALIKEREEEQRKKREEEQKRIHEEEKRKAEDLRKKEAEAKAEIESESKLVEEIRKRAWEREKMVKKIMGEEYEKREEEEELKMIAAEENKRQELLLKQKQKIEAAIENIPKERAPLDQTKDYLLKERARITKLLDPILESERKIEENIRLVERQELAAVIPVEKRKAEKERQILEIEREKIEQDRWGYEREQFKLDEQIKELDFKYQEIAQKEAKLFQELSDIKKEIERYEKRKQIKEKEREIENISKEKSEVIKKRDEIVTNKREIEEALAETKDEEEKIERELDFLKQEEMVAKGTEKQRVEKERGQLEKTRAELEKKKWQQEDERRKLVLEENRFNVRYQNLLERENVLRKEIDDINKFLGIVPPDQPPPEPPQATGEKKAEGDDQKKGAEKKDSGPESNLQKSSSPQKSTDSSEKKQGEKESEEEKREKKEAQKLLEKIEEKRKKEELLKKLESRRKEDEKRKEEEILSRIRSGITVPVPPYSPNQKQEISPATSQTPIIISPSAVSKKRILKILIFSLIAALILGGLGYFIWQMKKPPVNDNLPNETSVTPNGSSNSTAPSPPTLWESVIPKIEKVQNYKVASHEEISILVPQIYSQKTEEKQFIRVVFENTAENKFVGLNDFLKAIGIIAPEGLLKAVENEATIYLYAEDANKSLGFATKIKTPGILDAIMGNTSEQSDIEKIMSSWEQNLTLNLQLLGALLDRELIENPTCGTSKKTDHELRYCDVAKDCFGSCYSVYKSYLIFGTCCKSVSAAINSLK